MYGDDLDQVVFEESDEQPERLEDDLQELGDREAFEDLVAEREGWEPYADEHAGVDDDHEGDPLIGEPMEQPEL